MLNKKIWANFQRIIEVLIQIIVAKLSKIWVWDPGSGKNLFRIPDPEVKKAPYSGFRIRNTAANHTKYVSATDSSVLGIVLANVKEMRTYYHLPGHSLAHIVDGEKGHGDPCQGLHFNA